MKSTIFNTIQFHKVPGNVFDLSHDVKMSTKFGNLTPVACIETLPGDEFTVSSNAMVRLAPTIAPVMHKADVYIHWFYVPNRLMWSNFEDFITGGEDGANASVHPTVNLNIDSDATVGSLPDYFGIPTDQDVAAPGITKTVNAFPFAAYQKVYEDYYRDQNLINKTSIDLVDGDNAAIKSNLLSYKRRAWEHDYYTSALPWTQRGPEALLPLGTTAPLEFFESGGAVRQTIKDDTSPYGFTAGPTNNALYTPSPQIGSDDGVGGYNTYFIDVAESHRVDLSSATAASIIELRRALKLQEWLEKNATGGARYIENIAVHFGVMSSDKRLQRPEYVGGFSAPIKISEVLQTSETAASPQGTMAGHGISVGGSKSYKFKCEEHGFMLAIMSVMPRTAYQQGIHKQWLRTDKLDYAWPSFAHIGEQPMENHELYVQGTADDTETFGYTPRYAEYKFINSRVAGDYRTSLDFWHMGRKFSSPPSLNQDFIEMDPAEVERIWAAPGTDELWCQVIHNLKVYRKLPRFGTPRL